MLACCVRRQKVDSEELEIARLLLDAGYELNDVPYRSSWYKFGGTAIKMAAEQGATDIVQLFLDCAADPDIPGKLDGCITASVRLWWRRLANVNETTVI